MTGNIQRVAIAGGGITAWSAAAALKRKLPMLDVLVVSSPPPPDALADRIANTLPSIGEFHADLGLSEEDTIIRAQSGIRLGTHFSGWSEGLPDYVHAYGSYGASVPGIPFHQLWLREGHSQPYDSYSLAAELGRSERFATADTADAQLGYGLRLTVDRYCELMRAYALHLGATERPGDVADVEVREDGFVAAMILVDGGRVEADLFVDCTGPAARLRSRLDGDRESWAQWLLCDRVRVAGSQPDHAQSLLDEVSAEPNGWSSACATVFSSSHETTGEIAAVPLRQGRLAEPWIRNCVGIGDAAVAVEPLEWTNLHLVHSQIDRLVSMMPGADCAPVELAEYNRQCNAEADRVRDFIVMHYVTARPTTPFWKDVASIELPASLEHSLSLFADRGRLPYYEEETFTRDSWLAVLFGQGFLPRRVDPLAYALPADEVARTLSACRDSVTAFTGSQPSYRDFISAMGQRAPL